MERIACLLIGYVFGLFQTSYIIGKLQHDDIREHGSGNAGSTNALRVYGAKAGFISLGGDVLKCVLAILLVTAIFGGKYADHIALLKMYAGAGVILGHNYPFYLNFHGGKGIASTLGLVLAFDPLLALPAMVVFLGIAFTTKYVSLGSLSAYLTVSIFLMIFGQTGRYHMGQNYLTEMYILFGLLTALAFFRHRKNIVRLINGTESKVTFKKNKE